MDTGSGSPSCAAPPRLPTSVTAAGLTPDAWMVTREGAEEGATLGAAPCTVLTLAWRLRRQPVRVSPCFCKTW